MALTANTPLSLAIALESDLEPFAKLRRFDLRNVSLLFLLLVFIYSSSYLARRALGSFVLFSSLVAFGVYSHIRSLRPFGVGPLFALGGRSVLSRPRSGYIH